MQMESISQTVLVSARRVVVTRMGGAENTPLIMDILEILLPSSERHQRTRNGSFPKSLRT